MPYYLVRPLMRPREAALSKRRESRSPLLASNNWVGLIAWWLRRWPWEAREVRFLGTAITFSHLSLLLLESAGRGELHIALPPEDQGNPPHSSGELEFVLGFHQLLPVRDL